MSFETKIKQLGHRDWINVSSAWMPHVAQLSFSYVGQRPSDSLQDFFLLEDVVDLVPDAGEHRSNEAGLRAAMLHEGIYILHKAANVLVASHDQVYMGLPSWSIATAYQSAFFSMEAMLMFLGIAIVEVKNKTLTIDAWPEIQHQRKNSKTALKNYSLGTEIQYVAHRRVEHYHRWAIFKRVLRTLSNSPISGRFINAINAIDDKDFARQRNDLHYSNIWPFDDLHAYFSPTSYCRFQAATPLFDQLDPQNEDFSIILATTMLAYTSALLASLAEFSPLLSDELRLLNDSCNFERLKLRKDYESAMSVSMI